MEHIGWGLYLTVAGMGSVFLLLAVLMVLLLGIGRLDRPKPAAVVGPDVAEPSPESGDATTIGPDAATDRPVVLDANGLTPDQVAAIAVAVATHARVRRSQAAPAMRRIAPGSQLHASRWVAIGRAYQIQPWK